jgi:hypothetical protein
MRVRNVRAPGVILTAFAVVLAVLAIDYFVRLQEMKRISGGSDTCSACIQSAGCEAQICSPVDLGYIEIAEYHEKTAGEKEVELVLIGVCEVWIDNEDTRQCEYLFTLYLYECREKE